MKMKLIKVVKKDADDPVKQFAQKALSQSERTTSAANGFCAYEIRASKWNDKNFVEIQLDLPSYSMEGNADKDSVDTAIKITENRLKTLKAAKQKLATLQGEAKKLGYKLEK